MGERPASLHMERFGSKKKKTKSYKAITHNWSYLSPGIFVQLSDASFYLKLLEAKWEQRQLSLSIIFKATPVMNFLERVILFVSRG